MTSRGTFAMERFEGHRYSGRALMDYCDARAAGATMHRKAALPARADRIFCGICGAASFRRCLAAVP